MPRDRRVVVIRLTMDQADGLLGDYETNAEVCMNPGDCRWFRQIAKKVEKAIDAAMKSESRRPKTGGGRP